MSIARSDPVLTFGGRDVAAGDNALRPRAVAMRLAVDPRTGRVRLTLPPRAALAPALAWAESQRAWIEAALASVPAAVPIGPGSEIPFESRLLRIEWRAGSSRTIRIEDDRIVVGGPEAMVGTRVLRWMKAEAARRLDAETRTCAARAGVTVERVRVGDARTRWGSCSASGDIAYSWRLILAPPEVRLATVAHEVAHRLHMDHSPAFHAAVARLFGRPPTPERAWLRANGAALHAFGRDG